MRKRAYTFLVLFCLLVVVAGCSDAYSESPSQQNTQNEHEDNGDLTQIENLDDDITEVKDVSEEKVTNEYEFHEYSFDLSIIPQYENEPYYILNNNIPNYYGVDVNEVEFEYHSDFDSLGRCGQAFANIGRHDAYRGTRLNWSG